MPALLSITCLCGALEQTVQAKTDDRTPISIALCHCTTCRRTSGVLCTSYCPIKAPFTSTSLLLTAYTAAPGTTTRYFCQTCGCHVFRSRRQQATKDLAWEVATGVIVHERFGNFINNDDDSSSSITAASRPVMEYTRHENVADTGDGGLAIWLPSVGNRSMDGYPDSVVSFSKSSTTELDSPASRIVSASCHCGAVQFTVRPADYDPEASRQPRSGFADLLVPYASTDPAITANPDNVKWWLRSSTMHNGSDKFLSLDHSQAPDRWLAGTCACKSCRLATGFEIQTWAFVPRRCIVLSDETLLTFDESGKNSALPSLSAYRSSPGVERNFCNCCGATVFWHDTWRPDLIDVSVGLLQPGAGGGCRAHRVESLLEWCTTRVSFVEEASRDRGALSALRGSNLVESLEKGMQGK